MALRTLFALSVFHRIVVQSAGKGAATKVPWQFVYDKSTATSTVRQGGCVVTSWDGLDSDGMSGPPWVSYVNCSTGSSYKASGVAIHGDFQVWLHYGQLSLNGDSLSNMGESFWVANGAKAALEIAGSAYVAGAKFELDAFADAATFTASYRGPQSRDYKYSDAKSKLGNAELQHDPHICNGSSPSMDFVFGSRTQVDPPVVSVLNCAPSSSPDGNFVWSHFHPFGALYMPFSGEICFAAEDVICIAPGTARWTSPNLMYYEYFRKINVTNSGADAVRDIAGVSKDKCQYPNLFAVTNFDGVYHPPNQDGSSKSADPAPAPGVPNFQDWPVNAHHNKLALGIGPWGVFPTMTVQATKVVVKSCTVVVETDGRLDMPSSQLQHHLV